MAFVQVNDGNKPGKCYRCNQPGYWKKDCPLQQYEAAMANMNLQENDEGEDDEQDQADKTEQALGFIQCAFLQRFGKKLNPNHIYLDTCATFCQVVKDEFLTNVQPADTGLMAHCNAGTIFMDKSRYLGKMKVWHNALGLANILSFHELEQHYDISYGTKTTGRNFIVHTESGDVTFCRNEMGLPYIDLTKVRKGLSLINTVRENYEGYTKKEVIQAIGARKALAKVGHHTEREFTESQNDN